MASPRHRRAANEFRTFTNRLTEATFGLNVNAFRQSKGYSRNLRDHLTDLELSLLSLSETTAAAAAPASQQQRP